MPNQPTRQECAAAELRQAAAQARVRTAHSLLASLTHLTSACTTLAEHCISGITAKRSHLLPDKDGVGLSI
jgi:aspartate ammonia-lyase